MNNRIEITPALWVTGDGAAWLPCARTVVIADIHIGYARAARRRGGYLPQVETPEGLGARVLALADRCSATHVVVAGDLRHSTHDVDEAEQNDIAAFLQALSATLRVTIVAGNHDRGMSDTVTSIPIDGITIVHEPPQKIPSTWTICGHVHPETTVRDATGASARYPCFLVGCRMLVLPAFTAWAGGLRGSRLFAQLPSTDWRRLIVHDGMVFDNL